MSLSNQSDLEKQTILVRSLLRILGARHGALQLIETHISWVIVAGEFAYKLKKRCDLIFSIIRVLNQAVFFAMKKCALIGVLRSPFIWAW